MRCLIAAALMIGFAIVTFGQTANASLIAPSPIIKPIWDLDYEVYYGEEVPAFELWYKKPGQGWMLYGTYDTQGEASNRLFFLYEHNAHPEGTNYWIGETTRIKWHLLDTFETYNEATAMIGYLQMLGYPTQLKSVFGGYDYSHLLTPHQNNNPYYRYVLGD